MPTLMRGAHPAPRHRLAAATPHTLTKTAPPQFLRHPIKLSMWGNDVNGDCVTAEEAFAKACNPTEILISDTEAVTWATANGFLNGAYLTDVMTAMRAGGFAFNANTLGDGPYTSVDWTNPAILQNAIFAGPVKIGIAADQLEAVCQAMPILQSNWLARGFTPDNNLDHCVALAGYGPQEWLAATITKAYNVPVPDNITPGAPGYALFTWGTIGIIDAPSLLAITGEAWLRSPTSVIQPARR